MGQLENGTAWPVLVRTSNTAFVEELGVHFGNGSLFDDRRWNKAGFDVYGDMYDDQPYLDMHVSRLIEDAYGIKPSSYIHPRSATLILRVLSRHALRVKETVGLRPGRKKDLCLPQFLKESESERAVVPFLRGLVDIEGSLRFRKQFRDRHYYPVLECEMGDPPLIKALYKRLTALGMPVAFRAKSPRVGEFTRRAKASFYVSGWNGTHRWLESFGLANAKHLSKLLVAQKFGFCPPHTSLDERLGMIAGEIDPISFYERRFGDAVAVPRYRYAHEVLILRIASRPRILRSLVREMKVRGKLTKSVVSKLVNSRELRLRQTDAGTVVEATERGHERLQNLYQAWMELKSRFGIAIPDNPSYCPVAFSSKSVN